MAEPGTTHIQAAMPVGLERFGVRSCACDAPHCQAVRRNPGPRGCVSRTLSGRDSRPARGEWRRQIDADQDHNRGLSARSRRNPARWKAGCNQQRRGGSTPRDRGDLPGTAAVSRPERRRKYLHQPSGPRKNSRLAQDVPRCGGHPRGTRRRHRRAQRGARPDARGAAIGRDRQGNLAERARPHHGRAEPHRFRRTKSPGFSNWSATFAPRGSPFSLSAIAWKKCSRSPTR